jgi:hypothetical protein
MNLPESHVVLYWYCAGVFALVVYYLYLNFYKKEEIIIKVEDLTMLFLMAIAGFMLWLIPVVHLCIDIVKNYGNIKSVVLWSNKRAKNKEILFGDNDDDDKTKTYPKF